MRLSPDRVLFIAEQITDALLKQRKVRYRDNRNKLTAKIEKVIADDMAILAKIDAEAEKMVRNIQKDIPEGSDEWNARYQQYREEIAGRFNYEI